MGLIILLVLAAVLVCALVLVFNSLVRLRQLGDNAWADIDVQLKRRHNLVPNLVETVKGYAAHEKGTLESVVSARSRALSAQGPAEQGEAEVALEGALHSLFALVEDYPQLRAVEGFSRLQTDLSALEDAIQKARRYYNAVVRDLNTRVEQFPSNLVASGFGFRAREYFAAHEDERATPSVQFDR